MADLEDFFTCVKHKKVVVKHENELVQNQKYL